MCGSKNYFAKFILFYCDLYVYKSTNNVIHPRYTAFFKIIKVMLDIDKTFVLTVFQILSQKVDVYVVKKKDLFD